MKHSKDDEYGNLSEEMNTKVDQEETPGKLIGAALFGDSSELNPETNAKVSPLKALLFADAARDDYGNSFPSAAEPINGAPGARQSTGERTSPFGDIATEYKQPASNLPQQVSQSELLRQSRSRADGFAEPSLWKKE